MEGKQKNTDSNIDEKNTADSVQLNQQDNQKIIEEKLLLLEKENNKMKQKEVLLQADLQNVRKRAEREIIDAHKYGIEKFLLDLLPALDSISKGLEIKIDYSEQNEAQKVQEGLRIISEMIDKTMKKFGVEIIAPSKGEKFDPKSHDAVSTIPSEEDKKNTIGEVLRKGYKLNGRVLRAAMVVVMHYNG